jgi:outer membrane protein assembly factor BamB
MPCSRKLAAALSLIAAVAAIAGCGSDDDAGGSRASTTASGGSGNEASEVDWPLFGRVLERTHAIADAPNPPFHDLWEFPAGQLIEFPPVLEDGDIYVVNKTGELYRVRASDGKVAWKRNLGDDVTGPAYAAGTVYLAQFGGVLTAIDTETQKVAWTFDAKTRLESSPLVAEGRVFLGSDNGTLFALDAANGKLDWQTRLGHDVKASPSYTNGTVYVGDYEGNVFSVDAASGKVNWSTDTTQLPPGGSGGFYSSPALAFGRVYEARDDGTVYALDVDTGKLSWQFETSNAIYGSPAVADISGTGPSLFIGSYDHQLYALDAESGAKRWTYDVGGQVPGTASVVGDTVYTSSFQTKKTVGLDAATGKRVFNWGSAGYTPMISDGEQTYLTGFQTVWAFKAKGSGGAAG